MQQLSERKFAAIVFADISGFSATTRILDPEEVGELANTCFKQLDSIIINYGGTIDKHEGDLIMAVFGVPVAHEDDAERSVNASIQMMKAMPEINKILSEKLNKEICLGLHIGINIGEVVSGKIGSQHKMEYTVMGDAVNLASRIYNCAKDGEIVVSESVFKASSHLFEYNELPETKLKGFDETVLLFKVLGIKKRPGKRASFGHINSPLVGHTNELKTLKRAILNPDSRIIVFGEAGVGKSRIASELKNDVLTKGIKVIEGRCLSYGENIAYFPFLEIIKSVYKISDTDTPETVKSKLIETTNKLFPNTFGDIPPYIGYLLSVKIMEEKIKYLTPQDLKLGIFLAIHSLLNRIGKDEPTIFLIDNYHWIDSASLELMKFILSKPLSFSLLVLSRRVAEKKDIFKFNTEIELKPLDKSGASELIDNLLMTSKTKSSIPPILKENILLKSGGNPFYIEEILRSLINKGHLIFNNEGWQIKEGLQISGGVELPATVQGIIASRIDLLPPKDKEVLQMASVIGYKFYKSILEYLFPEEIETHLSNLEKLEFVSYTNAGEYIFKHPLTQEVAYSMILKKTRQELHKKVGEQIEVLFRDRIQEFYQLLSNQYYLAQVWDKAQEYSLKSGERARNLYYNMEAIRSYERVIDCALHIEKTPEQNSIQVNALLGKADILKHIGEPKESIKLLDNTLAFVCSIGDKINEAQCLFRLSEVYVITSNYEEAYETASKALNIFTSLKDKDNMAKTFLHIGTMDLHLNKYKEGLEFCSRALKTTEEIGARSLQASALNNIGIIYQDTGDSSTALKYYKEALKILKKTEDKREESIVLRNIGTILAELGEYKDVMKYFSESLKIRKEIGYKIGEAWTFLGIGLFCKMTSKYSKALDYYQQGLKINEAIGNKRLQSSFLMEFGEMYYLTGNYKLSLKYFLDSLEVANSINEKDMQSIILTRLSKIYLTKKDFTTAEKNLIYAKEIAESTGHKTILVEVLVLLTTLSLDKYFSSKQGGKEIKKAESYIKGLKELEEQSKSKVTEVSILLLLSRLELAKGKFTSSKVKFMKAVKILEKLKDSFSLAMAYYNFGTGLKFQGDEKEGKKYLLKSRTLFKSISPEWLKILE